MTRTTSSSLVSVVMPAYNAQATIIRSMESVLAQTWQDFELIVVNDGSTDRTSELARSIADPRIKVLDQPNAGVSAARNRAIAESRGRLVAFLDADDLWTRDKLARQVEVMDAPGFEDVGLVHAEYVCFRDDPAASVAFKELLMATRGEPYHRLLVNCYILTLTVMVRREVFHTVGLFDEALQGPEDWDMWIRIAKRYRVAAIPEVLGGYRESGAGLTSNKRGLLSQELLVLKKNLLASPELPGSLKRQALLFHEIKLANKHLQERDLAGFLLVLARAHRLSPLVLLHVARFALKKLAPDRPARLPEVSRATR